MTRKQIKNLKVGDLIGYHEGFENCKRQRPIKGKPIIIGIVIGYTIHFTEGLRYKVYWFGEGKEGYKVEYSEASVEFYFFLLSGKKTKQGRKE